MTRRPIEALLALTLVACAASSERPPVAVAPVTNVPAPTSAPAPASAPPPRPPVIRLSTGNGDPADAELAAGDDALAQGDVAAAEKHFTTALSQAPKSPAVAVGLARVRIARVDAPLDFGAAKGNASLA